jgi:putative transcriptional regulator
MSVAHHPDEGLLLDYAAGVGGEAQSLLVAAHVAFCPKCRDDLLLLEQIGGAMLSDIAPSAMGEGALEAVLARLDGVDIAKPRVESRTGDVPAPLRPFIGNDLGRVRWRRVTPGLSYRILMRRGRSRVYLTKSSPGSGIGLHTHRGNELTLVLSGGFSDEMGSYGVGDLMLTTPDVHHTPVADDDGDCITLAMTDAPLSFRNIGAGLVARIFGF